VTIRCDIEPGEEPTLAVLQAIDKKSDRIKTPLCAWCTIAATTREIEINFKEVQRALSEAFLVDSIARARANSKNERAAATSPKRWDGPKRSINTLRFMAKSNRTCPKLKPARPALKANSFAALSRRPHANAACQKLVRCSMTTPRFARTVTTRC
jgi:hypothetical protein